MGVVRATVMNPLTHRNHLRRAVELIKEVAAGQVRRFDKGGEAFYDQISALHKSVRGTDPDAALYWLARMLEGGEDPLYLARRLIRMATEDIGLSEFRRPDCLHSRRVMPCRTMSSVTPAC